MSASHSQNVLITNALSAYLTYSLQAALHFKEKLDCYRSLNRLASVSDQSSERLQELVQYLQEVVSRSMSLHALATRLAVIERLKNSISWSLLAETPSSRRGYSYSLCKLSADFLRFSHISEDNRNQGLTKDWMFASYLSAMLSTATMSKLPFNLPAPLAASAVHDVIESKQYLYQYILDVLKSSTVVVSVGARSASAYYQNKFDVLQAVKHKVTTLGAEAASLQAPSDVRLQALHDLQCRVIESTLARLCGLEAQRAEIQHKCDSICARCDRINLLRKRTDELMSAMTACEGVFTSAPPNCSTLLHEQYLVLCAERDSLLDVVQDVCAVERLSIPEDRSSVMADLSATAGQLLERVHVLRVEAERTMRACKLAAFYTAGATRAAKQSSRTPSHQKIAECWERAAMAVSAECYTTLSSKSAPGRHLEFVALAEGVFASAVTCHTQWERAVQRRDDKLADFWQRARERAWEVGCEALEGIQADARLDSTGAQGIVDAVDHASGAQELLAQHAPDPISLVEVDLRLLLADMLVTYHGLQKNTPAHRIYLRNAIELALEVTLTLHQPAAPAWPGGSPVVPVSKHVHNVLQCATRTLRTLYHLSTTLSSGPGASKASNDHNAPWLRVTSQITFLMSELRSNDGNGDAVAELQRMYLTDLIVWRLEAHLMSRDVEALWFELLASTERSAPHLCKTAGFQLEPDSSAITALRQGLADAIESEITVASADAAQWLQTHWPQERRGRPALGPCTTSQTTAVNSVMDAYRAAVHWKQRALQEATDWRARELLNELCERWCALGEYRRMWAVFCEECPGSADANETRDLEHALKSLGQSRETAVRAIELALRAVQTGNGRAHSLCTTVCADLKILTSQARTNNVYRGYYGSYSDFKRTKLAVETMLTCADHHLRSAEAELNGRRDVAEAWRTAAQTRETSLDRNYREDQMSKMLRSGYDDVLQRADAQAAQARQAEGTA
jgi:hypothetical protein